MEPFTLNNFPVFGIVVVVTLFLVENEEKCIWKEGKKEIVSFSFCILNVYSIFSPSPHSVDYQVS